MKKILFCLIVVFALSKNFIAFGQEYTVTDGMSINIPDSYTVITRESDKNYDKLYELGYSKEDILEIFDKSNLRIDAFTDKVYKEIGVTIQDIQIKDMNLLSKKELAAVKDVYESTWGGLGYSVNSQEEIEENGVKYIVMKLDGAIPNERILYLTTINNKSIGITIISNNGSLVTEDENLLNSVVKSVSYTGSLEPRRKDNPLYKAFIAAISAIIIGFAYFLFNRTHKKGKKNDEPQNTATEKESTDGTSSTQTIVPEKERLIEKYNKLSDKQLKEVINNPNEYSFMAQRIAKYILSSRYTLELKKHLDKTKKTGAQSEKYYQARRHDLKQYVGSVVQTQQLKNLIDDTYKAYNEDAEDTTAMKKDSGKGNYGYIAQRIACIYYVLSQTEYGRSLNEEFLLFVTAIIDMWPYISRGNIDIGGIKEMAANAITKQMGFGLYKVKTFSKFDMYEHQELATISMQLMVSTLQIETETDYHAIVDGVMDNKSKIIDTIDKTLNEKEDCILYKEVSSNASFMLNNDYFKNLINAYESNDKIKPDDADTNAESINNIDGNPKGYYFDGVSEFLIYTRFHKENMIWLKGNKYSDEFYKGYKLIDEKKYSQAIAVFKKCLEYNPVGLNARFEIAQALIQQHKWEEAKNVLKEVIPFLFEANRIAKFYRVIGYYYSDERDYIVAEACYKFSLTLEANIGAQQELLYIAQNSSKRVDDSDVINILSFNDIPIIKPRPIVDGENT